jgi:hypothetical protein
VLQRHGLPPAPERKRTTTWPAVIRTHLAVCTENLSSGVVVMKSAQDGK